MGKPKWTINGHKNSKVRMAHGTLQLNKVKEIRNKINVNFQCILHALLAGALRELYINLKLEVPKSAIFNGPLPWPKHPFMDKMTNWM